MALNVFSENIAFEVYGVAGFAIAQISVRVGVRNDGDLHDAIVPVRDSQADAIDGDGALRNDVARDS